MIFSKKGKKVGELINGTYKTKRDKKIHLMRIYGNSWGISADIYSALQDMKCEKISIITIDYVYTISMEHFNTNYIIGEFQGDKQYFVPLSKWAEIKTDVRVPETEQTSFMTSAERMKNGREKMAEIREGLENADK